MKQPSIVAEIDDKLKEKIAKGLGLEYIGEEDGGIGWDWYAQDQETGETYPSHAGQDQLEIMVDLFVDIFKEHVHDCLIEYAETGTVSCFERAKRIYDEKYNEAVNHVKNSKGRK